jgi:hypothetical protein
MLSFPGPQAIANSSHCQNTSVCETRVYASEVLCSLLTLYASFVVDEGRHYSHLRQVAVAI